MHTEYGITNKGQTLLSKHMGMTNGSLDLSSQHMGCQVETVICYPKIWCDKWASICYPKTCADKLTPQLVVQGYGMISRNVDLASQHMEWQIEVRIAILKYGVTNPGLNLVSQVLC